MTRVRKIVGILSVFVFVMSAASCARNSLSQLNPIMLNGDPAIRAYKDAAFSAAGWKTFAVIPPSELADNSDLGGGILEQQMMFELRNTLEMAGYRFVSLQDSPDFLVTMDACCPYREHYVPPQIVSVPKYVPGQTIIGTGEISGRFNVNSTGGSSAWGTYSGQSTTSTYVPGYMTTETQVKPGYFSGAYYPSVTVTIADAKTARVVWNGSGVGVSSNSDIRVSGQTVMASLLGNAFPRCLKTEDFGHGRIGVGIVILTLDGNNFYPTVLAVQKNSPAEQAGLWAGDIITARDIVKSCV